MYIKYNVRNILLCIICIAMSFSMLGMYVDECSVKAESSVCSDSSKTTYLETSEYNSFFNKEVISIESIQSTETIFYILSNIKNSITAKFGINRVKGYIESLIMVLSYADIVSLVALTLFAVNKLRQNSFHLIISRYIQNKDGKKEVLSHIAC